MKRIMSIAEYVAIAFVGVGIGASVLQTIAAVWIRWPS